MKRSTKTIDPISFNSLRETLKHKQARQYTHIHTHRTRFHGHVGHVDFLLGVLALGFDVPQQAFQFHGKSEGPVEKRKKKETIDDWGSKRMPALIGWHLYQLLARYRKRFIITFESNWYNIPEHGWSCRWRAPDAFNHAPSYGRTELQLLVCVWQPYTYTAKEVRWIKTYIYIYTERERERGSTSHSGKSIIEIGNKNLAPILHSRYFLLPFSLTYLNQRSKAPS